MPTERESNPHIELVKKWLADKDSVTQKELEASKKSTYAAHAAVDAAAAYAAASADPKVAEYAAYWVKRYNSLTEK